MKIQLNPFAAVFMVLSLFFSSQVWAQQSLPLNEFLQLARAESPDLAAQTALIQASKARASGLRIPAGMVGYMQMQEDRKATNGIEISQEIPFPAKMIQDRRTRGFEYQAQKQDGLLQKAEIMADARIAYDEFWAATARLAVLRNEKGRLHHHTEIINTTAFSDNEAQIHLLSIQSQLDLLQNDILSAQAAVEETRAALNIFAPSLSDKKITPQEPPLEGVSAQDLKNPRILWREKELRASEANLTLAKQSYLPDFYVRLREFENSDMPQADRELMVGISVPFLNFWEPRASVKEAYAQKLKARAELQRERVEVASNFSSLLRKAELLQAQILLLKNQIIPRAIRRAALAENFSQRSLEELGEHQEVISDEADLKLKRIDLRVEYERTLQQLRKLTANP